jgi:SAM-dependent methyltransferase
MPSEVELIRERYARRAAPEVAARYDFSDPAVYLSVQERERALLRWMREAGIVPSGQHLLEIGCGAGRNLLELLRCGFSPENLVGNELLPERVAAARRLLPAAVRVVPGDALELDYPPASFDIVYQSVVFTSVLDPVFQEQLARRMWEWVAPGGGVLWYDFTYDNPRNRDVAGVPLRRIRQLFPAGEMRSWRITLAPPVARAATRIHPALYTLLNLIPLLRTHVLCWIHKPLLP